MSFTNIGTKVSANDKTSSTFMQATPSSAIAVGRLAIAVCSADAISDTGESTDHTVSDDTGGVGNVWTRIGEMSQTFAALDRAATSVWYSVITTEIGTGNNVIFTIASAVIAKNLIVEEFSIDGSDVTVEDYGVGQGINTQYPEAAVSGLNSGTEHLFVFAGACDWVYYFASPDTDYTNGDQQTTIGGTGGSNINSVIDYRIASGLTADTCTATLTADKYWVAVLGALSEVSGVPPDPDCLIKMIRAAP